MSVDDRIRGALESAVVGPALDLEELDRAEADVRVAVTSRTRRRHRIAIASASALAAAAAVVVAVLVWPGPNHETVTTGPVGPPDSVAGAGHLLSIAWPGNGARGEVVVRSASTGRIERTWSTLPPSHDGIASLSATADGRYLYYGWQEPEKCISTNASVCTEGGIDRISLADGSVTTISNHATYALAVSPDGHYLAATQAAVAPLDAAHVTVTDLRTGTGRTWDTGRDAQDGVTSSDWRVTKLSFAPDDHHVAVSMDATTFGSPILRMKTSRVIGILDTDRPSSGSNPRVVPPGTLASQRWEASFDGSPTQLVALDWCGQPPCPDPARPVVIDVSTGRTQPLSGGLAATDWPAADVSLTAGRSGAIYALEPDLCPRCSGYSDWWATYRIESGVSTILASGSDGPVGQGRVEPTPQGIAWIP